MVVVAAAAAAVVAAVVVDLFVGLLVYPIFIVFLKRWILKAGKFVSAFLRFHIRQVRFCLQSSSMLTKTTDSSNEKHTGMYGYIFISSCISGSTVMHMMELV